MKDQYEYMRMSAAMRHHLLNEDAANISAMTNDHNEMEMGRFPEKTPIAMAYVPYQQWGDTYSHQDALCRGTIFKELDLPFAGGDCPYE